MESDHATDFARLGGTSKDLGEGIRIGFNPHSGARGLLADAEKRILLASGVPLAVFATSADSPRRPLPIFGRAVAGEATAKLDDETSLAFEAPRSADFQGLAPSIKALTDSEMRLAAALEAVGM